MLGRYIGSALHSIKTQICWRTPVVERLIRMKHLRKLELRALPLVHSISQVDLNVLLKALENLESLKITVTIMPRTCDTYALESQSLQTLDVSDCVNLILEKLCLPNLRHFVAKNVHFYRTTAMLHSKCLFVVLKEGCPQLQRLNDDPVRTESGSKLLPDHKICFCAVHRCF